MCHGFKPHGKQTLSALGVPGHDVLPQHRSSQKWLFTVQGRNLRPAPSSCGSRALSLLIECPPCAGKGSALTTPVTQPCQVWAAVPPLPAGTGGRVLCKPGRRWQQEGGEGWRWPPPWAAGLRKVGVCAVSLPPFKAGRALRLLIAQQPSI